MGLKQLRRAISSGVIAFPITPFRQDLSLDADGFRQNLAKLLEHPIAALAAPGGTGELYSLSPAEQAQTLQAACQMARGIVPVLAGVGFNLALAQEASRAAREIGADGVLVFPPYYPQPDWEGLLTYYQAVGRATALPMIIYSRDWAAFTPEQVEQLADIPTLAAWKDGQGDIRRLELIQQRVGDRLLWIGGAGDDLVPAYYSIGIRVFTSSIANVSPKLSLQLHAYAAAGRAEALSQCMQQHVLPLYALRARRKGYEVSAMKAMMEMLGLAGGPVRPPLVNLSSADRSALEELLPAWRPISL